MAGSQTLRLRGGRFAAALAVSFLTFAGRARAQNPSPPSPPAGMPAASFAEIVDTVIPPVAMPAPTTAPRPAYYPAYGAAPTATRVETGPLRHDHRVDLRQARSEHLAAAAALDALQRGLERGLGAVAQRFGRRARQGWINAADGNLYRLWFFTFAQGFNNAPKGNAYLGAYTLFTPLSRRLDADHEHPLRAPQQRRQRLAHHRPEPGRAATTTQSHTGFGDISFTPRVLLHETKDFSLTAELAVRDPDRHPAPRGEDDHPDPGRRLLEQLRGRLGGPGRARCSRSRSTAVGTT